MARQLSSEESMQTFLLTSTLLVTAFITSSSVAEPFSPTNAQLASSVVLFGQQSGGMLQATGYIVDRDRGWVVTTWHFWSRVEKPGALQPFHDGSKLVVAPTPYLNRHHDGKTLRPRLIAQDEECDLALIEIPHLVKPQAVSFARCTSTDEELITLGNPPSRNSMWMIEPGRQLNRTWREWTYTSGQRIAAPMLEIQVDQALSTGFSGGPVFTKNGEFAGMVIATPKPEGNTFYAVEADVVRRFLSRAYGKQAEEWAAKKEWTSAKRLANLAVATDPADPLSYLARSRVLVGQGRSSEAHDDIRAAAVALPLFVYFTQRNQP